MGFLESIASQFQGTKFTIYGSRLLSSDVIITYKKGIFSFPLSENHLPEFTKLLMAIISLKRLVKLNYSKFTLILEEKYEPEISVLKFDNNLFNEVSFVSNSTNSDGEEEEDENEEEDKDFVERTKLKLDPLKPNEEGLKQFSDWEDMLVFEMSKNELIIFITFF